MGGQINSKLGFRKRQYRRYRLTGRPSPGNNPTFHLSPPGYHQCFATRLRITHLGPSDRCWLTVNTTPAPHTGGSEPRWDRSADWGLVLEFPDYTSSDTGACDTRRSFISAPLQITWRIPIIYSKDSHLPFAALRFGLEWDKKWIDNRIQMTLQAPRAHHRAASWRDVS